MPDESHLTSAMARRIPTPMPDERVPPKNGDPPQDHQHHQRAGAPLLHILGMSCRFPGAKNLDEFWDLLLNKRCSIRPYRNDRGWLSKDWVTPDGSVAVGKAVSTDAGWLDSIDRFDHSLFKISRREAQEMDVQQRLALEVAYEALLDARINPDSLRGTQTSVFAGAGIAEHLSMSFNDPDNMTSHTMVGVVFVWIIEF